MAAKQPWLVPGVVAGGVLPLALLGLDVARNTLGPEPVAIALNELGLLALVLLVASLACTPLQLLFGWTWPIRIRKSLGLLAFGYAALHVGVYAAIDQGLDLKAIFKDVTARSFPLVGAAAFLVLIPLAATSTSGMLKRLGARRWKRLHRGAYVAAGLAALHFVLRVKKDLTEPLAYAAILVALLGLRALDAARPLRAPKRREGAPPAA